MTTRKTRTPLQRARIFEAHGGRCHICNGKIDGSRERWELEHVIPFAMTRDDSDENLAPAHASCHAPKTADDVAQIAKAKRVRAKHIGAHKAKDPLPGSRGSKYKRTVDGRTVLREEK